MQLRRFLVCVAVASAVTGVAQTPSPPPAGPSRPTAEGAPEPHEMPVRMGLRPRREKHPGQRYTEQMVFGPTQNINASDALDEMLDELAADIAMLGAAQVSPILLDHVGVSSNLNPEFSRILQSRLVAALHRVANVAVQRCYECDSTVARVENAEWVVSRGIVAKSDLVAYARQYNSRVVLTADLSLHENPNGMALDIQLVRADDAAIVFAEQYRFRPEDGLLYRTADRAQSREARLKDLEDRLANRPHFKHSAVLGVTNIRASNHPRGDFAASVISYRLLEAFGVEREWRFGISGSYLLNPTRLVGLVPQAIIGRRVTMDSLYLPNCHVLGSFGYFITLDTQAGLQNTRGAPQFALAGECMMVHRFSVNLQLAFFPEFPLTEGGYNVGGGVIPTAGVSYSW